MRELVSHTVRNVNDGTLYTIGDRKYQKQKDKWEIIETFVNGKLKDEPSSKESVLKMVEEFMDTDVELSVKPAESFDYFELLAEVKRLGVEVGGNPKREVLEQMYREATE